MPSVSQRQQMMMGADLARARAGKSTRTGMTVSQLEDFASTRRKGLPVKAKKRKMQSGGAVIGNPKDHLTFRQMGIRS
jgi:hypothetical protein